MTVMPDDSDTATDGGTFERMCCCSETDADRAKAAAEAAKAERLRRLEERLAAWQAQQ